MVNDIWWDNTKILQMHLVGKYVAIADAFGGKFENVADVFGGKYVAIADEVL